MIALLFIAMTALADPIVAGSQPLPEPSSPHLQVRDGVLIVFDGYLDVGFFDAQGDGVAYDRASGLRGPREAPWVFYGDPWANPVNSQGDSADLGLDRTNIDRTDRIASGGRPTFLLNTWHPGIALTAGKSLQVDAELDFEPRSGELGDLGDAVSVDIAQFDWRPIEKSDLHVYIGKVESTFGIEYRVRHAPDRFGITPSSIARYTTGTPLGVKVRGSVRQVFWYSLAATSTSTISERFGHFKNESTASGRLAVRGNGPVRVEVGASGAAGAIGSRQAGVDAQLKASDLAIRAEGLITDQTDGQGDWLRAKGGYVEVDYHLANWLAPLVRVDRRDADFRAGPNYYDSNTLRFTGGIRFDITYNAIAKIEYLFIDELGSDLGGDNDQVETEIADNVFTSSLVFRY